MKKILLVLSLLIIILIILVNNSKRETSKHLQILTEDRQIEVSLEDLQKLQERRIVTKRERDYFGYSLKEILENYQLDIKSFRQFIFRSSDGAKITFDKAENFQIALQNKKDDDYLRLIIPEDKFGQRWLKYLVSIELMK